MYHTSGVDAVATITELRSKTSDLIEHVRQHGHGVLIQKNNEPYAVLLDWQTYQQFIRAAGDVEDRAPKKGKRARGSSKGSSKQST